MNDRLEDDEVAPSLPAKDPNARPECFNSAAQEILFVIAVTMAVAMSAFLSGSVTVSITFAGRDLEMSNAEVTWMSAATSYVYRCSNSHRA